MECSWPSYRHPPVPDMVRNGTGHLKTAQHKRTQTHTHINRTTGTSDGPLVVPVALFPVVASPMPSVSSFAQFPCTACWRTRATFPCAACSRQNLIRFCPEKPVSRVLCVCPQCSLLQPANASDQEKDQSPMPCTRSVDDEKTPGRATTARSSLRRSLLWL